jgi:hypothetical protein
MYILIVDPVCCFIGHFATILISIDQDKFAAFCARTGLTADSGTVTACRTAAGIAVCPVQSGSVVEQLAAVLASRLSCCAGFINSL